MPNQLELARLEALLMREYLALPSERPKLNHCSWVGDLPTSIPPPTESVQKLLAIIGMYGACNVTTAASPFEDMIGVYVRGDVLRKTENPLRKYLRT